MKRKSQSFKMKAIKKPLSLRRDSLWTIPHCFAKPSKAKTQPGSECTRSMRSAARWWMEDQARGKRYDVAGLLVVLVLAKLAGMTSVLGASEWIADQEELLREGLGLTWNRMPCANTYSYATSSSGQSSSQCSSGSVVGAKRGRKPLWRRTKPFSSSSKRTACSCGYSWQSVEGHRHTGVWRGETRDACPACL